MAGVVRRAPRPDVSGWKLWPSLFTLFTLSAMAGSVVLLAIAMKSLPVAASSP